MKKQHTMNKVTIVTHKGNTRTLSPKEIKKKAQSKIRTFHYEGKDNG